MESQIDINSINKRALQLIRELLKLTRELFNWIRELSNWIRELSNWIRELSNWISELLIELESSVIHHLHLDSSLIEQVRSPIELKSSLIE